MNAYSLMLLGNPNVNFGEGQLREHENLLKSIKRDQADARQNALKGEQILKPMLLGVNQNIINYDLKFNHYYSILINALNRNDKSRFSHIQ
ncbi:HBL/NHE enterotoxin family protein [Bacillus sp. (in: firmicutes)]|uniref:HBL/NHE enterotoxin family protein n=1 Tax=Bacillus sp. TaxID=1409 RepID=UPI0039E22242